MTVSWVNQIGGKEDLGTAAVEVMRRYQEKLKVKDSQMTNVIPIDDNADKPG